jgi:adenosylcobyric acid synthase
MGETYRRGAVRPAFKIIERLGQEIEIEDGAISADGRVWGTYLHGLFDNDGFRRWFIDGLRITKGMPALGMVVAAYDPEPAYGRLADLIRQSLRIDDIYRIIGLP